MSAPRVTFSDAFDVPFRGMDTGGSGGAATSPMADFLESLREQKAKVERMKKDRIKKKRAALKQRLGHDAPAQDGAVFGMRRRETVEVLNRDSGPSALQSIGEGEGRGADGLDGLGGDLANISLPYVAGHSEASLLSGRHGGDPNPASSLHSRSAIEEVPLGSGGEMSGRSENSRQQAIAFQISSICYPTNFNKPGANRDCLKVDVVQEVVGEIVQQTLEPEKYDGVKVRRWCHVICERAITELQGRLDGFKIIACCVIVPRQGEGISVRSGSRWDKHRDGAVTVRRDSRTMHAVVTVWGLHTGKPKG